MSCVTKKKLLVAKYDHNVVEIASLTLKQLGVCQIVRIGRVNSLEP